MKRNADESPPWTRSNARAHTHADAVSRGAKSIHPAVSGEAVRRILRQSRAGVTIGQLPPWISCNKGLRVAVQQYEGSNCSFIWMVESDIQLVCPGTTESAV